MPSSSKKQHNFMAAVAHSPSFAKKVGVPQRVGKDFTAADKGKKFMNPRARKSGGALGYAPGGKVDWSANEANAMKPGEKQLGYGKPTTPKSPKAPPKFPKGKGSFNRDSITAEGRAKGVNFDKYGRVKAPSSVASDMVKKGAKFALDASPFGGIRKAGESVKKFLTTKSTKRPESIGKGGNAAKKYAEGGNVYSDESEGSEQSKKNIADAEVAKSKAQDAKGKLNPDRKRGFWGSLFTGHLKDYNTQERRRKSLQSTFGGMKSAVTIDAEKKRADLDKPKITIDLDPSELKIGPDMKAHNEANREARQMRKRMKREERQRQGQNQEAPKQEESKGESFGAWFKKQKAGSIATWTNPKTGEKKRILITHNPEDLKSKPKTETKTETKAAPTKKDDSKPAKTTTPSEDTTSDRREANRLRSSNPSYWDAAKKTEASKPRPSNTPVNQYASEQAYKAKTGQKFCGGGMTKAYRSGGLVSSRADGIASRGRTRCKIV